jgi:hypothetical protein
MLLVVVPTEPVKLSSHDINKYRQKLISILLAKTKLETNTKFTQYSIVITLGA